MVKAAVAVRATVLMGVNSAVALRTTLQRSLNRKNFKLRDQSWHPFKTIEVRGKKEEVIDEDDELLKCAKEEFGEEVYKAITTSAMELNEYNPNVREPVQEIWNFKERRRATTTEAISFVLKQLKSCRQLKASRRSAR
ncbi:hypothetical protein MKW98_015796 [Papaver atlanticum]|uniref:Factor of DNA methylation 1-5/IDN2 domain-containing protein n=1 Tax=Papaver atlanticum TaxID=357466 RepID=A0AAD4XDH6_9MAGN|nr:hypothetical protein MKW98_015796 [Papaver atlanticum]